MSHTLYRSQVRRNTKPHVLPVTKRKERGTLCFTGHKPEGTWNLTISQHTKRFTGRYSGRKAKSILSATLCWLKIRQEMDPETT
ncbi:hypothetical protein ACSBR1_015609 [Camellia fascicularis]